MRNGADGRVPVTILTGFLGAGKTTLLRRVLSDPQGVRFGVLVNDFGAINIDADLILDQTAESISLQNGCVCCSIRDDMVTAIGQLLEREPTPDRILIEASGVSRPLPIADALDDDALALRTVLEGIFCLIDGEGFGDLDYAATELAIEQAAGSDMVFLNKADLATEATLAAVEATLVGPIPRLRLLRTTQADVPRGVLFATDRDAARAESPRNNRHNAHDHHDHHAEAFAAWHWSSDVPVDSSRLREAMRQLPVGILRAKGILRSGDGDRLVLQIVGKRASLVRDADRPAPQISDLVAIGRPDLIDPERLDALFETCRLAAQPRNA